MGEEWSLFHHARLKTRPSVAQLALSAAQLDAVRRAGEFTLAPDGLILPLPPFLPPPLPLPRGDAASPPTVLLRRHAVLLGRGVGHAAGALPSPPRSLLLSGVTPPREAKGSGVQGYLLRLGLCDDLAEHPRVALALGLKGADGHGWCWRQRSRKKGHCQTNFVAQALCARMCGRCPPNVFGAPEPLDEAATASLRLREAAAEELPRPSLRARLSRAWGVLVGSAPSEAEARSEAADLVDDWEWWHARGERHPRGRLHNELRAVLRRSPYQTTNS